VRPRLLHNYGQHPIGMVVVLAVVAGLTLIIWAAPKGKEKLAFKGSTLYIVAMLVGAVFALYPIVLPATNPEYSLTIYNAAAGHHGLVVGVIWWSIALVLAVGYFVFIYRMFRGKVQLEGGGY
jgi:cytochrome d ubiquinol oxidase subunit II